MKKYKGTRSSQTAEKSAFFPAYSEKEQEKKIWSHYVIQKQKAGGYARVTVKGARAQL